MAIDRKISSLVVLLCGIFLSCEEEASIGIETENVNLLAVEAVLTNENINHAIRLTLPYQKQNESAKPVSDATVSVSDGTTTVELIHSVDGEYLTPKMRFVSGRTYTLTIAHNGRQYIAQDSPLPVEPLNALSYSNAEGGYRFNFFETGTEPYYIEYIVDWSDTPSCTIDCRAKIVYYDLKNIDANELFKPNQSDFIFPAHSTVIRRKFSVSDQYRAFLRSMLSETQWRGSVFDVQRDNAPTNLSEGAIGFFAVSTVAADTVKIP
ncbi:MAG TPA: DUF4249 family protein [Chryseosolibacter sp.]